MEKRVILMFVSNKIGICNENIMSKYLGLMQVHISCFLGDCRSNIWCPHLCCFFWTTPCRSHDHGSISAHHQNYLQHCRRFWGPVSTLLCCHRTLEYFLFVPLLSLQYVCTYEVFKQINRGDFFQLHYHCFHQGFNNKHG